VDQPPGHEVSKKPGRCHAIMLARGGAQRRPQLEP
jgi:hypothetical protein